MFVQTLLVLGGLSSGSGDAVRLMTVEQLNEFVYDFVAQDINTTVSGGNYGKSKVWWGTGVAILKILFFVLR